MCIVAPRCADAVVAVEVDATPDVPSGVYLGAPDRAMGNAHAEAREPKGGETGPDGRLVMRRHRMSTQV